MKYNVFISYRRDGGEYTAKILRDRLEDIGYNVFFDVEALRSGDFNTKLYSVIDECNDFILVLSPNALDRCSNDDDWVRREIEYALEKGKNIVPILLRGFKFPDVLPKSIESIRFKNGIEANTEFFDAFIGKLRKFLITKPSLGKRINVKGIVAASVAVLLVVFAVIGGKYLFFDGKEPQEPAQVEQGLYPSTNKEKNLCREVIYYTQMNLTNLDIMAKAAFDALDTAEAYLSSNERSIKVATDELEIYRKLIENADVEKYAADDALIQRLETSPFNVADFKALNSIVEMFKENYLDNLDTFIYTISDDFYFSDNYKLKTLAQYRVMLESELKAYQNGANLLLLPITEKEAMKEWFGNIAKQFSVLDLSATNWNTDKEALEADSERCWKKYEDALMEMSALVGYASAENAQMRKENDETKALIEVAEESQRQQQELEQSQEQYEDMRNQQTQALEMLEQ